eukprot:TRINITY_DN2423_c0_g1_i1.p1 TRINITY_DN2423_c0_g1~~TRINITY_DN2423_c0_g1_i1.p1  ORF type:complete len:791 (+),score=161.09 TRINITY_DN2423_c0_g1_i1:326-2698(+)
MARQLSQEREPNNNANSVSLFSSTFSLDVKEPTFLDDFICISEFSEQEGPVPLVIIPDGNQSNFNINNFVVKIMAVDYQNKSFDIGAAAEDTQFVMPEPSEDAYAYVHHLTLMDIYARGYVRPICMSYITRESSKVMSNFNQLLEEFTKVSNLLKSGNQRVFLRDIETRIADLRHTQRVLAKNKEEETRAITATPTTLGEFISDLETIHKRIKHTMKHGSGLEALSSSLSSSSSSSPALSLSSSLSQNMDLLDYNPQIINSLKTRNFDKKLRELSELCEENYYNAIDRIHKIHAHFSRPNIVLSLETDDYALLAPPSSLLTVGEIPLLNFNWELIGKPSLTKIPSRHKATLRKTISSKTANENDGNNKQELPTNSLHQLITDHDAIINDEKSEEIWQDEIVEPLKTCNNSINDHNHIDANLESFASGLWNVGKSTTGEGLATLRKRYSFAKHVLFSLLTGRTLLILAQNSNRDQVFELINTCSAFVPGLMPGSIVHWVSDNLKLSDFSKIKLAGVSKSISKPWPKTVERYVSIWDLEQDKLRAPDYQGKFVRELLNSKKHWPDDNTYLAFVHSKLLEIGLKACLFYQLCCVRRDEQPPPPPSNSSLSSPSSAILSALGRSPSPTSSVGTSSKPQISISPATISTSSSNPNTYQSSSPVAPPPAKAKSTFSSLISFNKPKEPGFLTLSRSGDNIHEVNKPFVANDLKAQSDGQLGRIKANIMPAQPSKLDLMKIGFFKQIGVDEYDAQIIEYMAEVVKEQQMLEISTTEIKPTMKLDYTPSIVHNNANKSI